MEQLISRQAAIDALCSQCSVDKPETCSTIQEGTRWCEEVYTLLNLPTVQLDRLNLTIHVGPKRGKWIATTETRSGQIGWIVYKCSNCSHYRRKPMNYCEVCGAKMER